MTKLLEVLKNKLEDLKQHQQKLNEIKEKISKISTSSTKEEIQNLLDEIGNIIPPSDEQRIEIGKIFAFNGLTSKLLTMLSMWQKKTWILFSLLNKKNKKLKHQL